MCPRALCPAPRPHAPRPVPRTDQHTTLSCSAPPLAPDSTVPTTTTIRTLTRTLTRPFPPSLTYGAEGGTITYDDFLQRAQDTTTALEATRGARAPEVPESSARNEGRRGVYARGIPSTSEYKRRSSLELP